MDEARRKRARARSAWPGQKTTLDGQTDAAIVRHGTPAERLAMLAKISRDAWALAGRGLPDYARSEMPGRIIRGRD